MEENNTCNIQGQSMDYVIQFCSRIFVLSLALLSLFFILITLLFSRRCKYWTFKTLIIQCTFEGIDVIGALSLSYNAKCHEQLCSIFGYIMHCSWQTSFFCSLTLVYLYNLSINLDSKYDHYRKKINTWLGIIIICPYFYLVIPLIYDQFGSTGWQLYGENKQEFFIFCGFKRNETPNTIFYLIFWILPIMIIFFFLIFFACKNRTTLNRVLESGIMSDEIKFLKKIQYIPMCYSVAWLFNLICRIIDLFKPQVFYTNIYLYVVYAFLNIIFELHLTVIAIIFYKYYREIIKIDKIWYHLVRFKIYNPKQNKLLIEELNSDFDQDDDDD